MLSRRPWSIRWWLAGFAIAVVLPLLLLLGWIFISELLRAQHDAHTRSLRVARAAAKRMRTLNSDSLALLERIAAQPSIRNYDGKTCDSLFAIVDFFPQYANLFLFDDAGQLRCSATPFSREDRNSSSAALQWIVPELRAGHLQPKRAVIRELGAKWVSVVTMPVESDDGASHSTLALVQLPDLVWRETLPKSTVVGILDQNGTFVTRADRASRAAAQSGRGQIALLRGEGTTTIEGSDGVARQYGFTYLPEMGWSIYVGIPASVVMRPVRTFYARGAAAGAAVVLFVFVISLARSRAIERPIAALVRAADSVAKGSYENVITAEGPLELVTLGHAFNEMVDSRSRAEQRMQEGERNLRALSDRLLVAQEEERRRIAREIHDDLGQSLTALKMDVGGLLALTGESPAAKPIRDRIVETLDATVTSVQRIAAELRPSILDDLGLVAAIETEARLFEERTGIECELSLPDSLEIDVTCASALYRIVREALTNVARHSNASRVELRLQRSGDDLLLEIHDDGRGLTTQELRDPSSLGLIGIRERAGLVGASVHFEGIPGSGTVVSVRLPMARDVMGKRS